MDIDHHQAILRELLDVVASVLPAASEGLDPATSLQSVGLDSVGMVNLLASLEERFALTFPPGEITPENFSSVEALGRVIARLKAP